MSLSVKRFVGGPLETNAYLVADEETKDAIVIDAPEGVTSEITDAVAAHQYVIAAIVITHGHWDHIVDTNDLRRALKAPVLTHAGVAGRITDPVPDASPVPVAAAEVDGELDEGDTVAVGGHTFVVRHLPGHDPAHIALYSAADKLFFGGDIIFPGGHGTTEIPGSDQATMDATIKRLLDMPGDVTVYPGHGVPTTFGEERAWMEAIAARAS